MRPLLELGRAGGLVVAGEFGVEELEEVDGEGGGVVVHFCFQHPSVMFAGFERGRENKR